MRQLRMIQVRLGNLLAGSHPSAIEAIAEADRRCFAGISRRRRREMQRLTMTSLLNDMMSSVTGVSPSSWRLVRDGDGAPHLIVCDHRINVSFSHSGPLAVAAITDLGEI